MAEPTLVAEEIDVRFGGLQALTSAGVTAQAGEITGLIGPNGAGKTTLFNVITGHQAPNAGDIRLGGKSIRNLGVHRRAQLGLSRTFQKLEAFNSLSARDNVLVAAEISKHSRRPAQLTDTILARVGLTDVAEITVGTLPTGTARLVELARALATKPQVLLLDEASSGLTEEETAAVGDLLKQLVAEDDLAVLLVEHDMSFVMSTCSRIHVLDFGQIIAVGTPEEIQNDKAVRAAYLGDRIVTTPLLELRGIRAGYGIIDVLHGVDLVLEPGTVLALLGPNGAGKSTTLAVASGQIQPSGGQLFIGGREVNGAKPDALARAGVCLVPEGRGIFPNLTVAENIRMMTFSGKSYSDVADQAYELFPRLDERRKQLAGTLSGGEQQMLAMARAMATEPALLMLDELSMGLAPIIVEELYGQVAELARGGLSILIVEQFAQTVLGVADTAAIMLHGHITRTGPPAEIAEELTAAYLGIDSGGH